MIAKLPEAETIVADKGYDSERVRQQVEQQGAKAVIPRKRNSVKGNADLDRGLYRNRHLVENAFARLKHYRAVASRLDKLKRNYESNGRGRDGSYLPPPRTDPYVRNYRIRLLPQVRDAKRSSG